MRPLVKRLALVVLFLAGCTGKSAAERARPEDPTYAGAIAGGLSYGDRPRVLVVDWEAENRVDLEVAMKRGVAVMALDEAGPRLLDCQLPGDYTFLGTTRKEKVVRLLDRDEVQANLPVRGAGLAGKLEGAFSRGATLDVALVMVGKRTAAHRRAFRDQLEGECSAATHIVRAATVGAFVMTTGTQAQIRSAAELFSAGAGASSTSERSIHNTEGDLSACKTADPNAATPPDQCGAALRVELAPVVDAAAQPEADVAPLVAQACPEGTELRGEKCEVVAADDPQQCAWKDPADCSAQCERDHPGSCYLFAWQNELGVGVPIDEPKARGLYEKACELGVEDSCRALAFHQAQGKGGPKELDAALAYYERACVDGNAAACSDLGANFAHGNGVPKDLELATKLYERACNGGDARGCTNLGEAYVLGDGLKPDPAAGAQLFERACVAEHYAGCENLGWAYDRGLGRPQQHDTALALFERACAYQGLDACVEAGIRYDRGQHAPVDPERAVGFFARACELNHARGCANLGLSFLEGRGVDANPAKAAELFQRTCAEAKLGCDTLGELYAKGLGVGKDLTTARGILEEACTSGDERSCEKKKALGL